MQNSENVLEADTGGLPGVGVKPGVPLGAAWGTENLSHTKRQTDRQGSAGSAGVGRRRVWGRGLASTSQWLRGQVQGKKTESGHAWRDGRCPLARSHARGLGGSSRVSAHPPPGRAGAPRAACPSTALSPPRASDACAVERGSRPPARAADVAQRPPPPSFLRPAPGRRSAHAPWLGGRSLAGKVLARPRPAISWPPPAPRPPGCSAAASTALGSGGGRLLTPARPPSAARRPRPQPRARAAPPPMGPG